MNKLKTREFEKYVKENKMIVRIFDEERIGAEKLYWEMYDKWFEEMKKEVPEADPKNHEHFLICHNAFRDKFCLEDKK